jgi:hypothetical protein
MKKLLTLSAIIEAATGLGLLVAPAALARLLLGGTLDTPAAVTVGRVAGTALVALGVACWLAASDAQSCAARGVVSAMVIYNLGAALVLGATGIRSQLAGVGLWPAVLLHTAMTVWCLTVFKRKKG